MSGGGGNRVLLTAPRPPKARSEAAVAQRQDQDISWKGLEASWRPRPLRSLTHPGGDSADTPSAHQFGHDTHTCLHKTQLLSLSGENVYLTPEKGVFSVITEKIVNSVKKKKKMCSRTCENKNSTD